MSCSKVESTHRQKMTWEEKISTMATIVAHNAAIFPKKLPHYEVYTRLLGQHPMNALAPLLTWEYGEGAYAIACSRHNGKATIYIAGENGVPPAKCTFIEELWSKVFLLRNTKRPPKKKRTEGNTLYQQIPDVAFDIWKLVIQHAYPKLRKRLRKHLPYIQLFQRYVSAATVRDYQARQYISKFISAFEMLHGYLNRLEKIEGPREAACIFASNREFVAMFMLIIAQFKNQMMWAWGTIDAVARIHNIGCEEYGNGAQRNYSKHFLKISKVFIWTHEVLETTRTRQCSFWDCTIRVHPIDWRDALPEQPSDPVDFKQRLQQVYDEALENADEEDVPFLKTIDLNIEYTQKTVPPELQLMRAFVANPPDHLIAHISTSESTIYFTEELLKKESVLEPYHMTRGAQSLPKSWAMPEGLLDDATAQEVYSDFCCKLADIADSRLDYDEDGMSPDEKLIDEHLRLQEQRLKEYRMQLSSGMDKMLRTLHGLPDENWL
ncbi:hypothetical protein KEM56_002410 [Ascosphaera pollenicola]|nr:hypothetical protein KEM56_002410 [Ascosphaera pollenicola]